MVLESNQMTNKMIDGEQLLEWMSEAGNFECSINHCHYAKSYPIHVIKKKIQSLMSEATDDKVSTVEPSAWQVGDLITKKAILDDHNAIPVIEFIQWVSNDAKLFDTDLHNHCEFNEYSNINAERRALQDEIYKKDNEITELLEENSTINEEIDKLKIDVNNYKVLYEAEKETVDELIYRDLWCYDLEKAPYHTKMLGKHKSDEFMVGQRRGYSEKHDEFVSKGFSVDFDDIIAWMPIPEPKGGA